MIPSDGKRGNLLTSANNVDHEIWLDGNMVGLIHRRNPDRTPVYVTIFNTCWLIPEASSEPTEGASDLKGTGKAKSKPNTLASKQLPTTD